MMPLKFKSDPLFHADRFVTCKLNVTSTGPTRNGETEINRNQLPAHHIRAFMNSLFNFAMNCTLIPFGHTAWHS